MKRIIISVISLFAAITISATTYYASPTGSGDGSSANKAGDFTTLVKKLKAGDILYLLEGQYNLQNISITTAGTSAKPITICNAPNTVTRTPILDFRTQAYGLRGVQLKEGADYWVIRGITLRYSGKNALHNSGSHNTFEDLDVYGNGDTGVQMKAGGDNMIINVDSHDNCDYQLGGLNAADFGGNADGFADKQYTGGANTYIGCRSWNNSDDGWDFFQRVTSGSTPTRLIGCICYQNGPAYYDFTNHGRYETDKQWFDQFKTEITITDADGNKIKASLSKYPNIGNGNGFKLGGGYTNNLVQLEHCLSVGNKVKGFDQNNNFGKMTLYNCSAYLNGQDYGFANANGGSLTIRNSITYKSKRANDFYCTVTTDHNSWNTNGISVSNNDFLSLDTTLILSARDTDGNLTETAFMHLKEGSKLIDAGIDVGLEYNGEAPDLGCYEYGGGEPVLPATLTPTSGNLTQTLHLGETMQTITLTWGGSAEDVTYTALPQGVNAVKDSGNKRLNISGTPTEAGNHVITVTTTGTATAKSLTITITVKQAGSGYNVAYITTPSDSRDKTIIDCLENDSYIDMTIFDANTNNDYTDFDLIVISPVPSSTAAGLGSLKAIKKPTLLLKPFMLKNTVWNWGNSLNTGEATIKITDIRHPIFSGLTLEADSTLTLFSKVEVNGVTCINGWYNSTVTEIATPLKAEGQSIVEAEAGSDMNGTKTSERFMMIGVSEYSTAYLTETATQLICNACHYLLGINMETGISEIQAEEGRGEDVIYTITGMAVGKGEDAIKQLPGGLYIINGKKISIISKK